MKNIKHLERLQQLHERIKAENTGAPKEMATQMRVCERTVYNLLEELRIFGASIDYNEKQKTYRYCNDFDIQVIVSLKIIQEGKSRNMYGGWYFAKNNSSLQGFCSERRYF